MILNLHSLAFNTFTASGGGNPAWGTEMGQGDGYRFNFEDSDEFITALVYNSVPNPQSRIYCPLGKGGNQASDYEFVIGSLFNKVFVNNILVNGKFLLLVVKKLVGSNHVGRRTLKYNPRMTLDGNNYNEPCYNAMARALGVSQNGSWFVSQINVKNQDELHFTAHVLDAENQTTFVDSEDRSRKLQEKLQAHAQDTNDSNLRKFADDLNKDLTRQVIYFGAPGTGKSFTIKDACDKFEHYRITFHPDTDYSSFVGSYKPTTKEIILRDMSGHPIKENNEVVTEDKIIYEFVTQPFLKAYIAAWKEQANEHPSPVFLIIEEINRGNCAQIFGDIFQLLDRNEKGFSEYSITSDSDLQKKLAKAFKDLTISRTSEINSLYGKDVVSNIINGTELLLPDNLFIRATMNTSDQSLFPIDSAFKRRWDWRYVNIKNHEEENYTISFSNGNKYNWWDFLTEINKRIEGGDIQQEDKKLGYFFAKAKNGEISAETFLSKVIFFLYNDVFKDFGLEQDFFKDEKGEIMTFASYFDHRGQIIESKVEKFLQNLGLSPNSDGTTLIIDSEENNEPDSSELKQWRKSVWEQVRNKFAEKGIEFRSKLTDRPYNQTPTGVPYLNLTNSINKQKGTSWTGLYMEVERAEEIYNKLLIHKETIDSNVAYELTWIPNDENHRYASIRGVKEGIDFDNPAQLQETINWIVDCGAEILAACKPYFDYLK